MNLGYDVFSIDDDRRLFLRAQGHMQDRPFLGDVDFVATKHGVDSLSKTAFFGQLEKQLQRFAGDAILGVIEVNTGGFCPHALAALRVVRE